MFCVFIVSQVNIHWLWLSQFAYSSHLFMPSIVVSVRHAWLEECAIHAMQKKLKLSFDGGDWWQEMEMRQWWCIWWGLAESVHGGSLESGSQFCVVFDHEDVFTFNLLPRKFINFVL
jgi:hypothetical protein